MIRKFGGGFQLRTPLTPTLSPKGEGGNKGHNSTQSIPSPFQGEGLGGVITSRQAVPAQQASNPA